MNSVTDFPEIHNGNRNGLRRYGEPLAATVTELFPLVEEPPNLTKSPELLIVMAMFKALAPTQRNRVETSVFATALRDSGDQAAHQAFWIIRQLSKEAGQ